MHEKLKNNHEKKWRLMMKRTIIICAVMTSIIAVCNVAQADFTPNQYTDPSYGIWFDRDGGTGSALKGYEILSGPTSGIYDVEVTYHAVDADTATMFARVNGIQQGFYINGVDFTPAGRSFTSTSLNAMQIFYWSRFPGGKAGDIGLLDILATGNLGTKIYSDLTWTKAGVGTGYPLQIDAGEFADVWDLTAGDLKLSYKVDFKDVWGSVTTPSTLLFEFGLKPDDIGIGGSPVGGGWMGATQKDLTASPGTWSYNDKFDLRRTGSVNEWSYDVVPVPVPGAVILGILGLSVAGAKLRRRA
jgi:hypothetical protein